MNNPRSVLDEKPLRIPIAGTIRTGIMRLTKAAEANPTAVNIYNDGIAAGSSYDEIKRKINEACKTDKSMLTPQNTPYFRVSAHDFTYPEMAKLIFDTYAEDRSNGHGKQLYRFPVVFAFDDWLQNMPHGLRAFTGSTLKYQSEYDATGKRFCMMHEAAAVHDHNKRAVRAFGGRKLVMRPENRGRCIPEKCAEYQAKACKLSGRLVFYIPGIPGSSMFVLNTTSFYSLDQMHAQMEFVARLRMGRISGVLNGKEIFTVTKVEEEVSMLDDDGKPKKTTQFLVKMETNLPMTELMAGAEQRALAGPQQRAAIAAPAHAESAVFEHETQAEKAETAKEKIARLRLEIQSIIEALGKDVAAFGIEMSEKHGPKWSIDVEKLELVLAELEKSR